MAGASAAKPVPLLADATGAGFESQLPALVKSGAL